MDTKGEGNGQQGQKKRGEMRFLLGKIAFVTVYTLEREKRRLFMQCNSVA
jgi:hypothetical protein